MLAWNIRITKKDKNNNSCSFKCSEYLSSGISWIALIGTWQEKASNSQSLKYGEKKSCYSHRLSTNTFVGRSVNYATKGHFYTEIPSFAFKGGCLCNLFI